jgi:sulfur relay (sulfurtransferase) complex TusBCD TusD component (DsrE family)
MKSLFIVNDPPYGTERVYNALRLEPEQFEHPCADLFLSGTHRGTILNHQLIRVRMRASARMI